MFTAEKISALFNATILLGHYPQFYSFIFNENVKDFQNVPGKLWELREYNMTMIQNDNRTFVAGIPQLYLSDKNYQQELWEAACSALGVKYVTKQLKNRNLLKDFHSKNVDVIMLTYGPLRYEMFLNPFATTDYAIFYKAGTFEVSSTYFMDGLSTELWICTWSVVLLMFIGFYISAKVYEKYFKIKSTIVDVAFYQMNFISNQTVESPYERFKAWKVQAMCGWFFNIVMMTATFTFIVALLSIKKTPILFKNLDDFARLRTHIICLPRGPLAYKYFYDSSGEILEKFRGIYNEPVCNLKQSSIEHICKNENVAEVWSLHQVEENRYGCKLIKMSGIFPKQYGSLLIQNDFKYREEFNRMYVLMQTSGIVQRAQSNYKKSDLKKNYEAKENYQVELEGVLFEHVKIIVLGYFMVFPFVMIILLFEIIHHRISMRKSSNIIVPIEEIEMKDLNQDVQQVDMNRSVPHLTQVDVHEDNTDDLISEFVEYLEVIDLE